ncbi:MAG TPA: hypothetical protein VE863_15930 [Pyrinomonadaceae bacterium]|nr:hypothetical protein [Pyrinomonadaceae bacterium]
MKLTLFLSIALMLASTSIVCAQSGRKSTGGSSSTTTTTTPSVAGPKTTDRKPAPTPKLQLLVGIDRPEVFSTVPYYLYDTVLDNVIRRLGEAEIVFANSGGRMNRADAVKAAKQEKTRWVVQLEIRSIYTDAGKQVKNNADELYVRYIAFEPETAKIKHSGQTRQHIYQNGRGGISLPSKNGPVYSEYSIKQTSIDAADHILADFDISVRDGSPF